MKFIDIFAGIGTMRMGFERAGHECVYSIEFDKFKRKIYNIIFEVEPQGGDINDVKADDIPRADVWCFGFPCQDISIAGKRKGFEGNRSSLFFAVTKLIRETEEEKRPNYLLIENVKNFFSINGGYDFLKALIELDEIGYDAEWQLLNSKNFGVPQNRERVFVVGHLRGRCARKIFPIQGSTGKNLIQVVPGADAQRIYSSEGISRTIKAESGGQGGKRGLHFVDLTKGNPKTTENARCLQARYNKGYSNRKGENSGVLDVRACLTPNRINKRQNGRRFKDRDEPMFALTKQDIHGVVIKDLKEASSKTRRSNWKSYANTLDHNCDQGVYEGCRIRRLTPKECWRLQGIDDGITDQVIAAGTSDTQMYRGAGDACTVNVIYEIARKMEVYRDEDD